MPMFNAVWRSLSQVLLALSLLIFASLASANPLSPHQRIADTTDALIKAIEEAKTYFDNDPERFYSEIDSIIGPLLDFNAFSRSVMGPYGKREYYLSLSPEQRQQFKLDYQRFVTTFRQGLVTTYAKGLLVFNGQTISVVPPSAADQQAIADKQPVIVTQTIQADNERYTLSYRMAANKQGEWKLRNLVIGSINVGQLYQNQFVAAMQKHQQNFAAVIDNWIIETKPTDFKQQATNNSTANSTSAQGSEQ